MAKKRKAEEPKFKEVVKQQSSEEEEEEEETSSSEDEEEEEEEESSSSEEEEEESSDSSSSEEEDDDDEKDDEASKREAIRKLLEPFGKDQIVDIVKEAALKDPSVLSRITQKAESDPTHRKIFVHGLGWETTSEQLLQAFKPFGEIEECKLITDKVTGRAKGYAFVLFKTRAAAKKALKNPQKKVGSRTTSCQLAAVGPVTAAGTSDTSNRKLFVANVSPNVSPDKLRGFFGKFGEIEEGPMGLDPVSKKPRGFAIFVYKSEDGLKKALEEPVKLFEGCQMNCKKFVEGLNSSSYNKNSSNQQQGDVSYGFGVNPGILAPNMNAGGLLVAQNSGIGLIGNPMLGSAMNHSGLPASGVSPMMGGIAGNYGINSVSPNVIGRYGSQAALQGLGAYYSDQMGQSSTGATTAGAAGGTGLTKAQSGIGTGDIAFPPYSGR